MRNAAVFAIAVLLASCTVPGNIISGITSNPFSDSVDLTEPGVLVSGVVDGKMEAEPYGVKRTADEWEIVCRKLNLGQTPIDQIGPLI